MTGFGAALARRLHDGPGLCVGIDPHPHLLEAWGLPDSPSGLARFGLRVVEAASGRAAALKPQAAFFERHGSAGLAALEDVLAAVRASQTLVIGDAKRGDIGTSVEAYGQAWLTPGSSLEVDALTVSAFQGFESLRAVIELARRHGKGLFVLCATSNAEAELIQRARTESGATVAALIAAQAAAENAGASTAGDIGLVIGATVRPQSYGIALDARTPVLAPGFGAQGAQLAEARSLYPTPAPVLASVSRTILRHAPQDLERVIDDAVATVTA